MESYWLEFSAVLAVFIFAVMSPGPDFLLITRNSLVYSRKTGIYSSLGLACGILVHVTYSLVGIGIIISQSIILFTIIKYIGACYLIYLGIQSLRLKPKSTDLNSIEASNHDIGMVSAIRMGFLTNVLNPKATLFFLMLFSQVVDQHTPALVQILYGLAMSLGTFIWFSLVSITLSMSLIKNKFLSIQHHIEKVFGVLLTGLGLKVAFSTN